MDQEKGTQSTTDRGSARVAVIGAVLGTAAVYLVTTERGRRWIRTLPEAGRAWAGSIREALTLLRELSEQVEKSVTTLEQALGRVGETLASRDRAAAAGYPLAGGGRDGGERSLTG